jgi:hypothetical protein
MRKFFWWISRDQRGEDRIAKAKEENKAIAKRITEEVAEDKSRIAKIREIRQSDNLANMFDDAFRMGRGEE